MALGCMVTGDAHDTTLHHCHGGSMKLRGVHRSIGRKTSDWLTICLRRDLHLAPGIGIDASANRPTVEEWEARNGKQADMLDRVAQLTGVDVWAMAAMPRPRKRRRKKAR
jgi:hypothetical protein